MWVYRLRARARVCVCVLRARTYTYIKCTDLAHLAYLAISVLNLESYKGNFRVRERRDVPRLLRRSAARPRYYLGHSAKRHSRGSYRTDPIEDRTCEPNAKRWRHERSQVNLAISFLQMISWFFYQGKNTPRGHFVFIFISRSRLRTIITIIIYNYP